MNSVECDKNSHAQRFFAHSREGWPIDEWELLADHLHLVANGGGYHGLDGAATFAAAFNAAEWGRTAGLWHDLGKYSAEFQAYLRGANGLEAHLESLPGRVDHATAGAQHAAERLPGIAGQLLAYCIAGHHGGLPDHEDEQNGSTGLSNRLRKSVPKYAHNTPAEILEQSPIAPPPFDWLSSRAMKAFQCATFCRMLFSCLVDADFLATESFMARDRAKERPGDPPVLATLLANLNAYLHGVEEKAEPSTVNRARAAVLAQCRGIAGAQRGFFSLTVPTGGGKSLSSLAFALRHAVAHDLRRVIYAIPFTSIIEQNVDVLREALADVDGKAVLEHHSNIEPDNETTWSKLASENWDAPVVVTTNVQLFESLFACKPARCRKLHRIARSVIILDECQTLPVTLLAPTLRMLEELCRNYGCSVVLCSATQPAVEKRLDFPIGLGGVREIIDDPAALHASLQRTNVERIGKLEDSDIAEKLVDHGRVLCVVNTRGHAAALFGAVGRLLRQNDYSFHLSAAMCAAHCTDVIKRIRTKLKSNDQERCIVVSTQLIEAGVDIDFPVVFRAMAGLDSIAQAAGRCNREGRLTRGQVAVFDTDDRGSHDVYRAAQITREVASCHPCNLLGLDAVEHYFRLVYWTRSSEWDKEEILRRFSLTGRDAHFQFREVAERYRLIRDTQRPVIVPYGTKGRALVDELQHRMEPPGREFHRRAQRFIVSLHERMFGQLQDAHAVTQLWDEFSVLQNSACYDADLGLQAGEFPRNPSDFIR